ncbi:hypothetical protein BCR33DRAFT_852447 [Rhizoclosmatium globosum]|uniref:Uncharacterized protein n=1 Tax=Rhizoclosmatium globosum TaxID=329046 RepID=A0A1Y2C1T5_9FUNG|nr:hypothetical protein BCR33DRAFT_852447 [Rhizoclosmatium globosum]|eukprot:ORY40979.1 hypothetical protein BCR33DRAFT_852447 [Rhizoclosmatium globosum]
MQKMETELRELRDAAAKHSAVVESEMNAVRRQFENEIGRLQAELAMKENELGFATQRIKNAAKAAKAPTVNPATASSGPTSASIPAPQFVAPLPIQRDKPIPVTIHPSILSTTPNFIKTNAFLINVVLRLLQNFIPSTSETNPEEQPPEGYSTFLMALRNLSLDDSQPIETLLPFFNTLISRCIHNTRFALYGVKLLKGIQILTIDQKCRNVILSDSYGFLFHEQGHLLLKLLPQSMNLDIRNEDWGTNNCQMLSVMSTLAFDCQPTLKSKFNGILTPEMIPIIFSLPGSPTVIILAAGFFSLPC